MDTVNTENTAEALQRDGAVLLRGVFSNEWIDLLRDGIDDVIRRPIPIGEAISEGKEYRGNIFLWKFLPTFHHFVFESPAAEIALRALRATRVNLLYDQLFSKGPGCPVFTPWHYDAPYFPVVGSQLCSIWTPVNKVGPENGGLWIIPGSHQWSPRFVPAAYRNGHVMTPAAPDVDALINQGQGVCWTLNIGDAILLDANVVHGSLPLSDSALGRQAYVTRWAGDDVKFDPRPHTLPMLWAPEPIVGEHITSRQFPLIFPRTSHIPFTGTDYPDPARLRMLSRRYTGESSNSMGQ